MNPAVTQLRSSSLTMGDIYGGAIGEADDSISNDTPSSGSSQPQMVAMSWVSFIVVLAALRLVYEYWMK